MIDSAEVANLLQTRGFDWAMRFFYPQNEAASHYSERLMLLRDFMISRGIGESAPSLADLHALRTSDPMKLDAFLEALVSLKSSEMIAAAWRMIQGMQLESLELKFNYAKTFSMQISLKSPCDQSETYSTGDIDDMNFVRHLMKSKSGDRPIINGFFALRRPK